MALILFLDVPGTGFYSVWAQSIPRQVPTQGLVAPLQVVPSVSASADIGGGAGLSLGVSHQAPLVPVRFDVLPKLDIQPRAMPPAASAGVPIGLLGAEATRIPLADGALPIFAAWSRLAARKESPQDGAFPVRTKFSDGTTPTRTGVRRLAGVLPSAFSFQQALSALAAWGSPSEASPAAAAYAMPLVVSRRSTTRSDDAPADATVLSRRALPIPPEPARARAEVLDAAYRSRHREAAVKTALGYAGLSLLTAMSAYLFHIAACSIAPGYLLACFLGLMVLMFAPGGGTDNSFTEMDEPSRAELEPLVGALAARASVAVPRLLRSDSEGPNAMVVGVPLPFTRARTRMAFTRSILRAVSPDGLGAVVGHELTHLRNGDMPRQILSSLIVVAGTVLSYAALSAPASWVTAAAFCGLVAAAFIHAAILRESESLADFGSARLMGDADPMSRSLLRLDIWNRVVRGENAAPVKAYTFAALLQAHPPVLARVESLRRLQTPGAPRQSAALGARGGWRSSSIPLLHLLLAPVLVAAGAAVGVSVGVSMAAALLLEGVAMLAVKRSTARRGGDASALAQDRLQAYLSHPDLVLRRWSAQALRSAAFRAESISILRGLRRALRDALGREEDAGVQAELRSAERRAQARERAVLKKSASKEAGFEKSMDFLSRMRSLSTETAVPLDESSAGRLGKPSLEFYRVDSEDRRPYFSGPWLMRGESSHLYVFFYSDASTGKIFVSKSFWRELSPRERIGLLVRERMMLDARKKFVAEGGIWTTENPDTVSILKGIDAEARSYGFDAARLAKIGARLTDETHAEEKRVAKERREEEKRRGRRG
ncbi:MAG: M48 family metalloprotease [Elusimicrobiota bacterium]|jgi:heat shock protein HtpX